MKSRQREIAPPVDTIEEDFRAALARIEANRPRNKELRKKANVGKLKISIYAVSKEAGHSRTLLSDKDCRYPVTRRLIKGATPTADEEPTTYSELIKNLRAEKALLKIEVRKYQDEAARQFNQRIAMEKNYQEAQQRIARLKRKLPNSGNIFPFDKD